MKYFILILVVLICAYIGYGLSSYYINRKKFYKNLELLFEKINLEINFSQLKLISILHNFPTSNKDVKTLLANFENALEYDLKMTNENLFKNIKIINDEEKNTLTLFFTSLGKFDVLHQSQQLTTQRNEIAKLYKNAEEEAKKFAPLYMKIGIILGLAIALILL